MELWPYFFLFAVGVVIFFLYRQGVAVSKSIRAILFVFRPGKDADRVTLNSCTGWVQHAGRFRESRTYEFSFDCQLSKGDVDVILLDRKKQQVLKLNRQSPVGKAEADGNDRYYLRWEFKGATGKCELRCIPLL